jgi:lactoylglutathione lyase
MQTSSPHTMRLDEVVPFLGVTDMPRSLAFYIDGLGFAKVLDWVVDDRIRWCRLENGRTALMLQEYMPGSKPEAAPGVGISLNYLCADAIALYDETKARGLEPSEPFVGNALWVTSLTDPDGFRLYFSSPTDAPEETRLSEVRS